MKKAKPNKKQKTGENEETIMLQIKLAISHCLAYTTWCSNYEYSM